MHLSLFFSPSTHFSSPCFFSPFEVLMSVVLHYAVPPGFNLASGIVGLTPRLWSPSAYYSLSLIGGPSGCRLVGGCFACRVDAVVFMDILLVWREQRDEKVTQIRSFFHRLHLFSTAVHLSTEAHSPSF